MSVLGAIAAALLLPNLIIVPITGPLAKPPTGHQMAVFGLVMQSSGLCGLLLMDWLQTPRWKLTRPIHQGILPGVLTAVIIIPLIIGLSLATQVLWHALRLPAPESHELLLAFNNGTVVDRWIIVISAVGVAPVFEEWFFRAHIQTAFRVLLDRRWLAIGCAAVLFAAVHFSWWMSIPLFVLGIGLGMVYERTANIYASIIVHALFNAVMIGVDYWTLSHH